MSSPNAAPSGSPPVTASPPAASTTPPPTSSSTPSAPPPSLDQTTPPAETPAPPPPAPISTSPPAPPPESAPPPTSTSTSPPPPSPPPPSPPPPAATRSPPPLSQSPPPPNQSSSAPAQSPASATQSPPPPDLSSTPPSAVASPPPPSSSSTLFPPPPPTSTSTPTTPSTSSPILSPPPPPTSASTPTTPSTSSPPPPPSSPPTSISTSTLAGILATGIVAATVVLILVYCFCKKKKKRVMYYSGDHHHGALPDHYQAGSYYDPNMKQQGWLSPRSQSSDVLLNIPPPSPFRLQHDVASSEANSGAQGMAHSKSWFTYAELATATNGFSKPNLLGEGGFGCVYKGVLANGQVIAVKQLKTGASQGEKEFQAEVEIISRVHHRNLVSLVGYCIADSQRLLVYDYVPNNTLEYHLHKRKGGPVMDWATRMKVASGAARGLAYLHEDCHPRIIHRDIKSANILLDNNFEAQVSDFGLAKLTLDTNTHVTTRVMGTFGYLAPEYASSGKLTEKSDVFSFGVVLLELLTGRKSVDISQRPGEESLVEWARPNLAQVESEEDLEMVVDPSLNGAYDSKEAMRMAEAAAACVRHSAHKRPRMGQVVRALEEEVSLSDLAKGLRPGHSRVYGSSFSSTDYENGSYSADMRKFRMALNENYETGGLINPSGSSSEYQTSLEIDRDTRRPLRVSRPTTYSSNDFSTSH